jgi:two-component system cell cycle sensor histidine kinase/response regulator CckA
MGRLVCAWNHRFMEEESGGRMKGVVLMIEDEEHIRIVFRDAMFDEGVMVVGIASGEDGVEFYREHHGEISLVVLDLSLPGISGEETFKRLKIIDPNVRVVVSSGFPNEEVTKKFEGTGIVGYLQKPYDYATLIDSVNKFLIW